jgi:hypothetical protein
LERSLNAFIIHLVNYFRLSGSRRSAAHPQRLKTRIISRFLGRLGTRLQQQQVLELKSQPADQAASLWQAAKAQAMKSKAIQYVGNHRCSGVKIFAIDASPVNQI